MTRASGVWLVVLLAGILAFGVGPAEAVLTLFLDDPADTDLDGLTIVDGGAGDVNPSAGQITFIGAVSGDSAWFTNVSSAFSALLGALTVDINSANTSNSEGTLFVNASDDSFILTTGQFLLTNEIGGTSTADPNSIQVTQCVGLELFQCAIDVTVGPLTGSPFSGSASIDFFASGPGPFAVSISDFVTIVHGSSGQTTFDSLSEITRVPTPAAVLLLGAGLLGMAVWGRRRRAA